MTTQDYLNYYVNLLPSQFKSQPNAVATIQTLAGLGLLPQGGNVVVDGDGNPLFDNGQLVIDTPYGELMTLALANAFNIQTAVGQQLQFLSETVGASNSGYNLLGQFVTLSDTDFRSLLQAVSARNFLVGTTPNIVKFMKQFFNGVITVIDEKQMHMTFVYNEPLGSTNWIELFITQGFLPRPLGVGEGQLILGGTYFGVCTYENPIPPSNVKPLSTYVNPVAAQTPILIYNDTVAI